MSKSRCKVEVPSKLPESDLSRVQFKAWKEAMVVYLKQNEDFLPFLPGGNYDTWIAAEDNPNRIVTLADGDAPRDNAGIRVNNEAALNVLLEKRQKDLHTLLSIVGGKVDQYDYDDVLNLSTSLDSIWLMLEVVYDIGRKGVHFLELSKIKFERGDLPAKFYKKIYHHIMDNLYKTNDQFMGRTITEDEKLTPTLLNFILFYTIESIDGRLVKKIKEKWGHLLDSSKSLHELKDIILKAIPELIIKLDSKDTELAAFQSINKQKFQQLNPRKAAQLPRVSSSSRQFCRLCQTAGVPKRVYSSHNISNCSRWTKKDVEDLRVMMCEMNTDPNDFEESESDQD